jgi:uncharacterized membrane protein
MDLSGLVPYLLFLHVLGAILAFGPTFAYSIMGAMSGREPQHANFSARQVEAIGNKLVYPLAIFQGITGVLLILATSIDLTAAPWLAVGIVLYATALTYSLTVQRSALHHLIELTSTPPPPGAPPGPPPLEVPATVKKIQRGGMFLGLLVVVIVFLMVVKPTF